jgi:hypothetical protein
MDITKIERKTSARMLESPYPGAIMAFGLGRGHPFGPLDRMELEGTD